jgi:hypothetical protein
MRQAVYNKCVAQVKKFQHKFNVPDKQIKAYQKLFDLIQQLKQGHTDDVDFTEIKGILQLLEIKHQQEDVNATNGELALEQRQSGAEQQSVDDKVRGIKSYMLDCKLDQQTAGTNTPTHRCSAVGCYRLLCMLVLTYSFLRIVEFVDGVRKV